MTDKSVAEKIVEAMPDTKDLAIVEIGPGLGDLTKVLMRKCAVEAYEVDESLYNYLLDTFKEDIIKMRLKLHFGDVLARWNSGNLSDGDYFIVANIPYYITTPIICKALEDMSCVGMILMVQNEVAKKLTASFDDKEYSSLGVLTQILGYAEILFEVPNYAFNPPPKITSAVIRIDKKRELNKMFKTLNSYIFNAFLSPRKRLFKNLSNCYDKKSVSFAFEKINLSQNIRPHELSPDTHLRLFREITA